MCVLISWLAVDVKLTCKLPAPLNAILVLPVAGKVLTALTTFLSLSTKLAKLAPLRALRLTALWPLVNQIEALRTYQNFSHFQPAEKLGRGLLPPPLSPSFLLALLQASAKDAERSYSTERFRCVNGAWVQAQGVC